MVINLHCNLQVESFKGNVDYEFLYGVIIMSLFMWPVQICYYLHSIFDYDIDFEKNTLPKKYCTVKKTIKNYDPKTYTLLLA